MVLSEKRNSGGPEKTSQFILINIFAHYVTGYQPESEWYRAQSESLMIAANDLSQFISVNVYIYTVYKVCGYTVLKVSV